MGVAAFWAVVVAMLVGASALEHRRRRHLRKQAARGSLRAESALAPLHPAGSAAEAQGVLRS